MTVRPLVRAAGAALELRRRAIADTLPVAVEDLGAFARLLWPVLEPQRKMRWHWYHQLLAREIQSHYLGNDRKPLVVCMPPRTGKSALVSIFGPAWLLLRRPEAAIVHFTNLGANSDRDARAMRSLLECDLYRRLVVVAHEAGLAPLWRMTPGETAVSRYTTDKGGGRLSRTMKGAVTGVGADLMIIDDPNDAEEVAIGGPERAARLMNETWERFEQVLSSRLNPGSSRVQVAMQRLHEVDLAGRLIARGERHVVLPMVAEVNHPQRNQRDPRKEGEALDDVFTQELPTRSRHPQRWAAQDQQRPAARSGGIFKRDTFLRYRGDAVWSWCLLSVDAALKPTGHSEYVIQAWGVDGARLSLLDMVHGHWSYPEFVMYFKGMCVRHPRALTRLVEDAAAGSALLQDLSRAISGLVPITPLGSKVSRAEVANGAVIAGNVLLPEEAPWLDAFESQVFAFPNAGGDDIVDTFTQAVGYVLAQQVYSMSEDAEEV